jgi:hypothetical protein
MDLHHEPSPSHGEMQNSYTLRAEKITNDDFRFSNARNLNVCTRPPKFAIRNLKLVFPVGLAPTKRLCERETARLLGAQEQK